MIVDLYQVAYARYWGLSQVVNVLVVAILLHFYCACYMHTLFNPVGNPIGCSGF